MALACVVFRIHYSTHISHSFIVFSLLKKLKNMTRPTIAVQEGSRRFKFQKGSRMWSKKTQRVKEGSRKVNRFHEGSSLFMKFHEGSIG